MPQTVDSMYFKNIPKPQQCVWFVCSVKLQYKYYFDFVVTHPIHPTQIMSKVTILQYFG